MDVAFIGTKKQPNAATFLYFKVHYCIPVVCQES